MEMARLYARAVAGKLPLIGGGGGDTLPTLQPTREGVEVAAERLAAYDRVCGFRLRDELPSTYVHVLAFPLALRLLTDRAFPFGAMGLVHVRNRIVQHRPLRVGESLHLRVRAENLAPHDKGRTVDVVAEARVGDELAWEDVSTYLQRESDGVKDGRARDERDADAAPRAQAVWSVPGDIGRRYASVSGDSNPIHLSGMTAKLFGMPRPIAHGMWLKARCLAALEGELPESFTADVRFKLPVFLPGKVAFATWTEDGGRAFGLHDAESGKPHLTGTARPR
jgi:acyl dehydratase